MTTILGRIAAYKREEIAAAKAAAPLAAIEDEARAAPAVRPFAATIAACAAEDRAMPVLRKDFMLDPYQVPQSRALGADCILVIMAAVDDFLAMELTGAAHDWGMDVLVEVHDEDELDRALSLPAQLIGINNRDLKTFETSLDVTRRLIPRVPKDRFIVSESGIFTHADIEDLTRAGAHAFLVGESLMREEDVGAATRRLLALESSEPVLSAFREAGS
jgi:indole-3-glycerol phosphate synthase